MNINKKHLATLDSVGTHIYVDGGRILTAPQLDEEDTLIADHQNAFAIGWDTYDIEFLESMSKRDRDLFDKYQYIAERQTKDICFVDVLMNHTPEMILAHNIRLS